MLYLILDAELPETQDIHPLSLMSGTLPFLRTTAVYVSIQLLESNRK
jgi:hypothetical protein